MKIHEVEALVGITKKNIRFYEEQGLLSPRRNSENGYREYGEEEVEILMRIKLLRKLGIPIDEIRKMQNGYHTVGDVMRRHLVTLEREKRNLQQAENLCLELQALDAPMSKLDARTLLDRMESMEQAGTTFQDPRKQDVRSRYVAPVIITVLVVAVIGSLIALLLWGYQVSPEDSPPLWFVGLVAAMLAAVGVGVVLAMTQRLREIGKGEIDDAKSY